MRDGVKLHTVLLIPRGAKKAPILLTRTPRPLRGPLNKTPVDHATDTFDTIDWLVKNVPETNGKVGILGISYNGFLPLMALVNPRPALKVSVPMNPMVDGWRGDDWFHYGAFRQLAGLTSPGRADHRGLAAPSDAALATSNKCTAPAPPTANTLPFAENATPPGQPCGQTISSGSPPFARSKKSTRGWGTSSGSGSSGRSTSDLTRAGTASFLPSGLNASQVPGTMPLSVCLRIRLRPGTSQI